MGTERHNIVFTVGESEGAGQGFWVERETDLGQWKAATSAEALDTGTAPLLAYAFNSVLPAVYWAASQSQAINLCYTIPVDFDREQDLLRIRFTGVMGGTTDTPTITASGYRARAGETTTTALTSVVSDAVTGTTIGVYDILMSGNELRPGDCVRITLTPGSHTTDILYGLGIAIGYKSVMAPYEASDR